MERPEFSFGVSRDGQAKNQIVLLYSGDPDWNELDPLLDRINSCAECKVFEDSEDVYCKQHSKEYDDIEGFAVFKEGSYLSYCLWKDYDQQIRPLTPHEEKMIDVKIEEIVGFCKKDAWNGEHNPCPNLLSVLDFCGKADLSSAPYVNHYHDDKITPFKEFLIDWYEEVARIERSKYPTWISVFDVNSELNATLVLLHDARIIESARERLSQREFAVLL